MSWWRDGVLYQVYPRSFADGNGDGNGDLAGLRSRLDYLQWLGVDAVWLNPITPSPNADWGYDVSDYCSVGPDFGDLDELDALVADAAARGIRVVLDLVPNHTSDRHPWFVDALSSPSAAHRDWYVWARGRDGGPPNNWESIFGGSAWTLDEASGEWYLHNFLPGQPDLNWWSDEVRDEFERILRFWFDRGIAGFRIDVAHALVKDRELRDDPPATAADHPWVRQRRLKSVHSMNRPEVHEIFRRWRQLAEEYDPSRLLLGETYVLDPAAMAEYYGSSDDELQLAFNFSFLHADFDAAALRAVVEATEAALPPHGWPVWTMSTHDAVRFPTRWCRGNPRLVRCALLALLTMRGTPVIYYGDELGLPETDVPEPARRDMARRDGARTPMPWADVPGAGFTEPGVEPWLPFGDLAASSVEAQRDDAGSTLSLTRSLIRLRREVAGLRSGGYASLPAPDGVWAWRRGDRYAVAVNLGEDDAAVDGFNGTVILGTSRTRAGERLWGSMRLGPAEGALVELKP